MTATTRSDRAQQAARVLRGHHLTTLADAVDGQNAALAMITRRAGATLDDDTADRRHALEDILRYAREAAA